VSVLGLPQVTTPSLETVGPGFAGFVAIFALALVTVLLLRSMVRHLRKVRYSPDPAAEDTERKPQDTPGDAPGRGA
jgi:hypothetical protein